MSSRPMPSQRDRAPQLSTGTRDVRWVGLKEAEALTGIPVSTIRNWARKNRIESRFELDESGHRRYVAFEDILARADQLGRSYHLSTDPVIDLTEAESERPAEPSRDTDRSPVDAEAITPEPESPVTAPTDAVPSSTTEPAASEQNETVPSEEGQDQEPTVPEGSLLVPIDAWNKMLQQLGNLHEAGQQLAEARERAAKAETEAQFLRERLAELRNQVHEVSEDPGSPPATEPLHESPPVGARATESPLWVEIYRRWNRRRQGRR